MSTCDARYGDVTCDRPRGHTGMHCGSAYAKWYDGDPPAPDPRDAELARLRAIVGDVADTNPCEFYGMNDDLRCFYCGEEFDSREESVADVECHSQSCAWRRAREEMGKR